MRLRRRFSLLENELELSEVLLGVPSLGMPRSLLLSKIPHIFKQGCTITARCAKVTFGLGLLRLGGAHIAPLSSPSGSG